jgi:ABC-type antimicrobial peptide transport system permease subunit
MAMQSLWQRSSRTLLTLSAIALTVGAIMALEGWVRGAEDMVGTIALGSDVEIMIRQADIADTSLSAIDERVGQRIAALPEVASVSGILMTAVLLPDSGGFFIMWGYAPNEFAIRRFNVVEGQPLSGNHQILLGRLMADSMNRDVGDTVDLSGARFKVIGIYETGVPWEELGWVVSLRDAQTFAGRPRKVTMYGVKVQDPTQAREVVATINGRFPEAHAALAGEFAEQMPDMENAGSMLNGISVLAIVVGGVGVLNTMLMAVLERTREIGVLRALGWRRRRIMGMILREALLLGLLGGGLGIGFAFAMNYLLGQAPLVGEAVTAIWAWDIFVRAIGVALMLGLIGGLYPAFRATLMQPTEALRYE